MIKCLLLNISHLVIHDANTCKSIKSHHTVTVITKSIVITVSLLWCSIDKYTNYCQTTYELL